MSATKLHLSYGSPVLALKKSDVCCAMYEFKMKVSVSVQLTAGMHSVWLVVEPS